MSKAGVNVPEPISDLLYCISNGMRRSILSSLAKNQETSFSDLMRSCGLSPKYDPTGTFTYHLSELDKINALEKTDKGYRLTKIGRRMYEIVRLLERESHFLHERREEGGERTLVEKTVVVRRAFKEDNADIAYLVASYYYETASLHYQVPKDYFERRKRETDFTLGITGRNLVYVAEERGEVAGICWWMMIEKENVKGGVDKEAFLEHLYVKQGHDCNKISVELMKVTIPVLLEEEKVTIINVLCNKDESLKEDFYAKFDIKEPVI